MATRARTIPGFKGLLVAAMNRHDILEFDGRSIRPIKSEFPHLRAFVYEQGVHIGPDGSGYGFGIEPKVVFYIEPDGESWHPLDSTRVYDRAYYDHGSGDAYVFLSETLQPQRFTRGQAVESEPLPVFRGESTKSVVTLPELSMKLALTGFKGAIPHGANAVWFKTPGQPWKPIRTSLPEAARMITTFEDAKIHIDGDLIRIFPKDPAFEPLFLRYTKEGVHYAGSAPPGYWSFHTESESWIGWIGKASYPSPRRRFFLFGAVDAPETPLPFLIMPGSVRAGVIPGVIPPASRQGNTNFFLPKTIILEDGGPVLLSSLEGFVAFDGQTVTALEGLTYEKVGTLPDFLWLDGSHFVHSQTGVFDLNDDLSTTPIDTFPIAEPWPFRVWIKFNPLWRAFVVVDKETGAVFTSPDMRSFTSVEAPAKITRFVAFTPDRTAALLVGADGLYTLGESCE